MRTISIRQPWPWLILRPDLTDPLERARELAAGRIKTIENRDWATAYRGPCLIHAGVTMAKSYHRELRDWLAGELGIALPDYDALPRGGVVGRMRITGCVTEADSPFWMGPYGWQLADAQPLPFVPWKGQLGFFDVPAAAVGLQPEVALP